jgi:hypothetical protein
VVVLERNLDSLTLDLLGEFKNVRLGLLDVLGLTSDLDLRPGRASLALARDINGDAELLLELTSALAATADKQTVLVGLNLEDLGSLRLLLSDKSQDGSSELLNDRTLAFEADSVAFSIGLGEASQAGTGSAVSGTTSLLNKRSEVGACELLAKVCQCIQIDTYHQYR